jgi:hypothetical protein
MAPTNRDASQVTAKKRNIALFSYYTQWKNATGSSSSPLSATPGPAGTSAELIKEIQLGGSAALAVTNEAAKISGAEYDRNVSLYPANPSSGGAGGLTGHS